VNESGFNPDTLSCEGDVTLALGRRTTSSIRGARVKMHEDVINSLRQTAAATLETLKARTAVDFTDDLALEEEKYALVSRSELVKNEPEPRRGRRSSDDPAPGVIELDAAALDVLDSASSLDFIGRNDLKRQTFLMYAFVVGDDPSDRVAFVKQSNPYRAAQLGQILTQFGDGLKQVTDPVLTFATDFDLVVTRSHVAVLNMTAFEKLFRDIDRLEARVPIWSQNAVEALPLSDESATALHDLAKRNRRVAHQLRGIRERGFLAKKYRIADLKRQMKECGLDSDRLVHGNRLSLSADDIPVVLKIIDEKLYNGWHSETHWDVGTRASR
jgi:hypothetical protein